MKNEYTNNCERMIYLIYMMNGFIFFGNIIGDYQYDEKV